MLTFAAVILAPHGLRHHGYPVQACTEREAEEGHNTLWVVCLRVEFRGSDIVWRHNEELKIPFLN